MPHKMNTTFVFSRRNMQKNSKTSYSIAKLNKIKRIYSLHFYYDPL